MPTPDGWTATEDRFPVQCVRVCLRCHCGGEFRGTGRVQLTAPPRYPLACNNCGEAVVKDRLYPFIDYVEVNRVD